MKRVMAALFTVVVFVLTGGGSGLAQQSNEDLQSLKKEIETLKEGQTAIRKDLQEIKDLVKAAPGAPPAFKEFVVSIAGKPMRGKKESQLVLVEFSDYQ